MVKGACHNRMKLCSLFEKKGYSAHTVNLVCSIFKLGQNEHIIDQMFTLIRQSKDEVALLETIRQTFAEEIHYTPMSDDEKLFEKEYIEYLNSLSCRIYTGDLTEAEETEIKETIRAKINGFNEKYPIDKYAPKALLKKIKREMETETHLRRAGILYLFPSKK